MLAPRFYNDHWSLDHTFRPRIITFRNKLINFNQVDDRLETPLTDRRKVELRKLYQNIQDKFPSLKNLLQEEDPDLNDLFRIFV